MPTRVWKLTTIVIIRLICSSTAEAQEVVVPDSIVQSNGSGLENLLQGNVAGLRIKNWSGTAGSQSIINMRGFNLDQTDDANGPLFLVNGTPIISSPSDVTGINPLSYFSFDQIERIEIFKDIDQLAIWGLQAPNGAINIVIKEGVKGPIHVNAKATAGIDYFPTFSSEKSAFYNFNPQLMPSVYSGQSLIQEQHIAIDGGGDYGSYLFGINNYKASGGIRVAGFQRQNLFVNAKYNIAKSLAVQFYNNFTLADRNNRYAGQYNRDLSAESLADERFFMDDSKNVGLLSTMDLRYEFSPTLSFRSIAGLSYETAGRDVYIPSAILDGDVSAASDAHKRQLFSLHSTLNYRHQFSDRLNLDFLAGNQIIDSDYRITSVTGQKDLESGGSDYVKIVTGYNANQTSAYSDFEREKLVSFYGVMRWDYGDKLFVNMSGRADGSSLYQKKWAFYPAMSIAYDFSQEFGLPSRLKMSYGKTGLRADTERYRGELVGTGDYFAGNKLGINQLYAPFEDAKSATIRQFDAKLDMCVFKNLSLQLAYFDKQYTDFTYIRYLPNIQGMDYQFETGAALSAHGFEFTGTMRWFDHSHFSWISHLNFAAYKSRIKELPKDVIETDLNQFSALSPTASATSIVGYANNQLTILGDTQPTLFGGFNNDFRLGRFTLGLMLTYSRGANAVLESYNSQYNAAELAGNFPITAGETPYYFKENQADGDELYQGISKIESTDFARISRLGISYSFGDALKKWKIKEAILSLRGENIYTLSKYSGINPEENITGVRKTDLSLTGTPLPASILLGIQLTF